MRAMNALSMPRLAVRQLNRQQVAFAHAPSSSNKPDLSLFKELNAIASKGLWDPLNSKPKFGLYGAKKAEAYSFYNKFNTSTSYWHSTAGGPYLQLIARLSTFIGSIWLGVKLYEFFVPEEQRLHYKYRAHHGHGDEHDHGDHHAEHH